MDLREKAVYNKRTIYSLLEECYEERGVLNIWTAMKNFLP